MKAVLCVEHGPPEGLVVRDIPAPEPGEGQVRVRVHAAGVNFPDTLIIQNLYQFKPPLPFSPGGEAAGVIDALGAGVTDLAIGDRVVAMTGNGCFAEQVVARRAQIVPIPGDMPFDIASGFTMTYGTSHHALKQRGKLQAGETLLVLGAAGGVGLTAVELGKVMGARVIAAASSDEKLALCRDYGADETINYSTENLKDRIKALTGGKGADVIYDPVGDRYAEPAFRSIAWNGRYLVVGFAAGAIPSLPLNLPLIKGASIVGVFWGAFTQAEPVLHGQNMAELLAWYEAGKIKPHVSKHFSLDDGPAAIRWMMDRKATGKVVLDV
ncbi:NADPH:quinone oxidoreductase family protein [Polymorphobacter fuscus]|uniref:Zinc-binding dehydrogenase n=1 Tax=Sandarakinorhabdus fusca TaxID=1439888 RepID=A0A7C9GMN8_9SPHN|nr:NADPH:quinone oxidoreductase family protein [Polymorphobacter fuscus]KAB7648603.1 NADPH:quinone oxidoreductase family protein [Polymorphobacter fuscus]MQT16152.1 zinc-binding dehydrogenase [Polymorphobacter fuscus]NJC07569.1 NADPH2:quinone reductase [Polymorphobacter fuscus]